MRGHKRSILLALLLCCIGVITMAGIYRRERVEKTTYEDLVKLEEGQDEDADIPGEEEVSALIRAAGLAKDGETDPSAENSDTNTDEPAADSDRETDVNGEAVPFTDSESIAQQETAAYAQDEDPLMEETLSGTVTSDLDFRTDSVLTWPVQGEVLMEFSVEQPVYFATLEQYKPNPGLLIQAEEGDMVYAGADGCVTAVGRSEELGSTVTLELGNGYTAVYGQLKSLNVKEGDMVSTGAALGLVAAPTKYYCVEGDHVYLQLAKDGTPVDPLDYLD